MQGFLGTLGMIRIFIKNFAMHAKPLVQLTRKDGAFEFGEEQFLVMEKLKHWVKNSMAIKAIDYTLKNEVVPAVDSSWMAVGFILLQMGDDRKRYPSRYGSIMWNNTEQWYSQAKLELYALFRALKAIQTSIIGIDNFVVEVDAKYIEGMINNPDIQPSVTINRWIAGALLFDFKLRHVSAKDHAPADGLSWRCQSAEDPETVDEADNWIDQVYYFGIKCLNCQLMMPSKNSEIGNVVTSPYQTNVQKERQVISPKKIKTSLIASTIDIPQSDKAKVHDQQILEIRKFLQDPVHESQMSDQDFSWFMCLASDFFLLDDQLWKTDRHRKHKLVITKDRRLSIIKQAHNNLGHKRIFTVRLWLAERFWWPSMEDDIKWYIQTCHKCQLHLVKKILIPPTIPTPTGLFCKVYIDTMLMPKVKGYWYIIHACCSLLSYPKWLALCNENYQAIAKFIPDVLLCWWGAIEIFMSDNAPQYIQAIEYLAQKYHICYIKILLYNSWAQGPIERRHYNMRSHNQGCRWRWVKMAGCCGFCLLGQVSVYTKVIWVLTILYSPWSRTVIAFWLGRSNVPSTQDGSIDENWGSDFTTSQDAPEKTSGS